MGDRLRKARDFAGLDQTQLADRLGTSSKTIGRYENEAGKPKRYLLVMWAMACGVNVEWLETGEMQTTPSPDGDGVDGDGAPYQSRTGDLFITSRPVAFPHRHRTPVAA